MSNLNRRQFLQMLAATGLAAGLPLPALQSGVEQAQAALPAIDLDAPVTPSNPLCWIELDGVRYGCKNVQLWAERELDDISLSWDAQRVYRLPPTWKFEFDAYYQSELNDVMVTNIMHTYKPVPFRIGGNSHVYSGEAVINEMSVMCEYNDFIMLHGRFDVVNQVARHVS